MCEQMSDSPSTCVIAVARICQIVAGEAIGWSHWPDFDSIGERFTEVPTPVSYQDALMTLGLLLQFTQRLGAYLHRRVHADQDIAACGFDPARVIPPGHIDPLNLDLWNPGWAVRQWLKAYEAGLAHAHRDELVVRAKRRLAVRLAEPLTVRALARELGCSVAVLQRRFTGEPGDTPTQYRRRQRAGAAIGLLRGSDLKIEAVARDAGWKSKKDLYRALDEFAGLSPAAVRALSHTEAALLVRRVVGTASLNA
jgi:AraC-like DNA-binding protein